MRRLAPTLIRLVTSLALVAVACGHSSAYGVSTHFTPSQAVLQPACALIHRTYRAPVLPAANRVLGDLVLHCKGGCPQEYAEQALLDAAHRLGASHVSSLSCVRNDRDWECVGRASAPQRCEGALE